MRKILVLAIAASFLMVAACEQKQAGNTVRIGVFMSLTGSTANFGISSVNGIKMATDEANAQGGINGKQIELLVQDDRSDAAEAATIVTKFVTQDQVHAILGEVASSRSIAAAPIAQNAKIPMLSPSSTNPEVTRKGDYIFRTCFTDPVQGAAIGEFAAKTLNAKRAGILIDPEERLLGRPRAVYPRCVREERRADRRRAVVSGRRYGFQRPVDFD